jgi:hypothetical protein
VCALELLTRRIDGVTLFGVPKTVCVRSSDNFIAAEKKRGATWTSNQKGRNEEYLDNSESSDEKSAAGAGDNMAPLKDLESVKASDDTMELPEQAT